MTGTSFQKGLDSITEVFTNIDGWLEDTAEEMADYDYGGWLNIFAEYGQGYAGRGGSFTVARLLGCVTKGGEKLCYGIFAGSINLFSHPIQAAGSIDKIPEGVQEGWNQFKNGNWTQRVEIATEVAGTVAMLAEAGVKMKNARNAAKARAEMEGILADDAEAVSKLEGVGAGTSEITEDMRSLLEEYRKLSEEEQWSMWKETGCFLAGTKVSTVEGMRNIEEISVGEEVYAENTISGELEKTKVTRISHQKASTFVYLRINGSEICSTVEHPFWHKEKGWIKAEELLPGDTLKQRDGEFVKVTYICQRKEKEQWVYNLEVEGLHTYYVAEGELLVHNGEGVCPEGKVKIESAGEGGSETVTYRRVQGGKDTRSRQRVIIDDDGNVYIPDKERKLNISIDNGEHSQYYVNTRRPGADIYEFEVPKWFDDFVKENTIPQQGYRSNPLNQGRTAPSLNDISTPGTCIEFPAPWIEWIEEYASNGRVIKGGG